MFQFVSIVVCFFTQVFPYRISLKNSTILIRHKTNTTTNILRYVHYFEYLYMCFQKKFFLTSSSSMLNILRDIIIIYVFTN